LKRIDVRRRIIKTIFKDMYPSELREIRLRQTEFSIYLVEQFSSIQFITRILEHCIGLRDLDFS